MGDLDRLGRWDGPGHLDRPRPQPGVRAAFGDRPLGRARPLDRPRPQPGVRAAFGERGQASVELVALLPLIALLGLLCWQAVVAGQAVWLSALPPGPPPAPTRSATTLAPPPAGSCPARSRKRVQAGRRRGSVTVRLPIPPSSAGST
ncbi:MAG: hypothetical protein R2736_13210 [Solirubrobacterales bacterium]